MNMPRQDGPIIDAFYDREKHRFKSLALPIIVFLTGIIIVFIIGFFSVADYLVLFSYIMFVLALVSLLHDHWITNSLVAPMWVLFAATTVVDIVAMNVFSGFIHGTTAVACIIASTRHDASLTIEMLASAVYGIYIYMVNYWGGVYSCGFWFCDAAIEGTMIFAMGAVTALCSFIINLHYKKRGGTFDCDGGYCPL